MRTEVVIVLALSAGLAASPAATHHSPAMFDTTRELVLEGSIVEYTWRNPHIYLAVEVQGPDSTRVVQQIEAGPASNLLPAGVKPDSLRSGERVTVRVNPSRSGPGRVVGGVSLTKSDGTVLPLHVRAIVASAPSSATASSLAGTWVPQAAGFSQLAGAAARWPLTDAGRAAVAANRDAMQSVRAQCIPFGPPALMSMPLTIQVDVSPNTVTFALDVADVRRVVHLDPVEHAADVDPSLLGYSIGHFEGDALVVDTTRFSAHPEGYAFDLPSSASKHMVERFSLSADRKHLDYEIAVEDREYFSAPLTYRGQWDYRPDQKPTGLPCDLDVARRFFINE